MVSLGNMPEIDLLWPVCQRWREMRFVVRQEVRLEGQRIDVVADLDERLLVCASGKMHLNDEVTEQARLTQGICDASIIVVPYPQVLTQPHVDRLCLLDGMGLGLTYVRPDGSVYERLRPATNQDAQPDRLRAVLHDQQKHWAPAGSKSEEWTPERQFLDELRKALKEYGEIPFGRVHRLIGSPYTTNTKCVNALRKLAASGRLGFADVETRGGQSVLVKR